MKRHLAALATVVIIAASVIPTAAAYEYFNGNLGAGSTASSSWNYWYAEEVNKGWGTERLGMVNSAKDNYIQDAAVFMEVNRDQLGMGGYMYGYVKNVTGGSIWNDAHICVC